MQATVRLHACNSRWRTLRFASLCFVCGVLAPAQLRGASWHSCLANHALQVAFEQPPAPLDTPYKVDRRSSKIHATAAAAAAAAAEPSGGEMGRNGSGQRWLGSP